MKLFYNILTGFLFALIDILQSGVKQFEQFDNRRDGAGQNVDRPKRYYLQYDSDEQHPAIGGEKYNIYSDLK